MLRTPSPTRPAALANLAVVALVTACTGGCCVHNPFDRGPKFQLKNSPHAMRSLLVDLFPIGATRKDVLETINEHDIAIRYIAFVETSPGQFEMYPSYHAAQYDSNVAGQPLYRAQRMDQIEFMIHNHIPHLLLPCLGSAPHSSWSRVSIDFDETGRVVRVALGEAWNEPGTWVGRGPHVEITAED